jgi:predicted secreted Zn-dependent protease
VHVSIADSHAVRAEKAIRELPPTRTCAEIRLAADALFKAHMAEHQADQLRFDFEERGRIAALVQKARLESRKGTQALRETSQPAQAVAETDG